MGNGQSIQPLTAKETTNLGLKYHMTNDGVVHYHRIYTSLLTGLRKEYSDADEKLQICDFLQTNPDFTIVNHLFFNHDQVSGEKLYALFPKAETLNSIVTFSDYLDVLFKWRAHTSENRLDFFFNLLDYNQDGLLTPSDISIFIQQSQGYICQEGDQVRIRDDFREGVLAYIGPLQVHGVTGQFAGINLTKPLGKNNGTLEGKRYFEAKENHGVFIDFNSIELDQHYKQGVQVIELLGGKDGSLTKDQFLAKCANDKWLVSRLNLDPINSAYLKQ